MTKKILYVSYDGMTDPLGQSQVIPYLERLTKQGYNFTILSVEKKKRLKKSGAEVSKILSDVGIKWETLIITTKPPIFSKIYDQWKMDVTAKRLHRQEKFDLIHCRSYVAAAAGLKLFKRYRVPFLFDMRGFWVDERVDSHHWNIQNPFYRFLYKLYKKKERQYFKNAAHIISLTRKGKEELVGNYSIPAEKISVIPCCADLNHFDSNKIDDNQRRQLRKKLGLSESDRVLSYLGSLGGWYMTNEMLDFFSIMKRKMPGTIFLFITHDNSEIIFKMAAAKKIMTSEICIQAANRDEVPLYLSISDWSVFFIKDVYSKKASSPTKQGEIMAMGIPIICNDIGDTAQIINSVKAGVIIDKFNDESYSKAVDQLLTMRFTPSCIRQGALQYYNLYTGVLNYSIVYKKLLA